jgi:isopenicillin-N epimerase
MNAVALRDHWTLDPDVVFLNHGSFGACPRPVLEVAEAHRALLEREPVRFFERFLESELDGARTLAAAFVGARPDDFAFVHNASSAVSAVLRSLELGPGDVLLTTDHAYGACRNALDFVAEQAGAEVRVATIPLPVRDPGDVVERILDAARGRVKLALVDHVTSPTGLVFPIETIVRELRERGIETLVDGAHAPGMLALDVEKLGAGFYTGNFHKWVCAPKGAAMLVVRDDLKAGVHPNVISHGLTSRRARPRFLEEFDWTGTAEPSAWLAVPEAIRFVGGLVPGGWDEVRARNRATVLEARRLLTGTLGTEPLAPESMIGTLAALRVPRDGGPAPLTHADEPLHRALFDVHRIEVPVFPWPKSPERLIRVSAHLYNVSADYERLARALEAELGLRAA